MKKIALIGTHAVGKTTICHELVASLKKKGINAEYLVEIAREAQKAGFKLNEQTTKESQKWILHTQIAREIEFETRPDAEFLLCDRSVLDNYVYYINQFGVDAVLDKMINTHMKTYGFLFKVPINPKFLTPDKVRSVDPLFQKKIDELLEKELIKRKINFQNYPGLEPAMKTILM